jgi:hypothetical protein
MTPIASACSARIGLPASASVSACAARSIGETAFGPDHSLVWIVSGSNGDNRVEARGQSQAEAWYPATLQAQAVGMLAARKEEPGRVRFWADCHPTGSLKYPRGKTE